MFAVSVLMLYVVHKYVDYTGLCIVILTRFISLAVCWGEFLLHVVGLLSPCCFMFCFVFEY